MYNLDIFTASSITATWSAVKLYMFWTTLHWAAIQVYQEFCAPKTVVGYFMTPIMSQAPHCKIATWIQHTSTNAFNSMTALALTWGSSFVMKWHLDKPHKE